MSHTGYLIIDHRASPGIPGHRHLGEGSIFECDTRTCNHCSTPVMMNPERVRARYNCPKCDAYLCDWCAEAYKKNMVCKPFKQVVEEVKLEKTPTPQLARFMRGL